MKWFKHISDSLDDPFIFELMNEFGADGYLVFFGCLEIYSREFKTELGWKLCVTRSYLKQKLNKRQDTVIIKCLRYIGGEFQTSLAGVSDELEFKNQTHSKLAPNSQQTRTKLSDNSKKLNQNSGKWEIEITDDKVTIFIPKFTELIDEWSKRKLTSNSVGTPKILNTDKEADKDKELDKDIKAGKSKQPPVDNSQETAFIKELNILKYQIIEKYPKFRFDLFIQNNLRRKNHQAILHTLKTLLTDAVIDNPSAWCEKILKHESMNYNATDSENKNNEYKKHDLTGIGAVLKNLQGGESAKGNI